MININNYLKKKNVNLYPLLYNFWNIFPYILDYHKAVWKNDALEKKIQGLNLHLLPPSNWSLPLDRK